MSVLVEQMPIAEGYLTVWDTGDYQVIHGDPDAAEVRFTFYRRGSGPRDLQILVERILATEAATRWADRERAIGSRLTRLEEANEELRERLRRLSPGSGTAAARIPHPPTEHHLPPNCRSPAVPVTMPRDFTLREIPPGTIYCSFTPLYEIFADRVRFSLTVPDAPPGDWTVSLFNCGQRFAEGGQCNRHVRGMHSQSGRIAAGYQYLHDPFAWSYRKLYFRIRNGSTEPLRGAELRIEPILRDPVLQMVHDVLMWAGFLPGIGIVADGADMILYILEGDYGEAVLSAASMVPLFGDAARGGTIGSREIVRVSRAEVERLGEAHLRREFRRLRDEAGRSSPRTRRAGEGRGPVRDAPDEVDRAFDEGPFESGELRERGRMRRPRSTDRVPAFDTLPLTAAQRAALRRISGQYFTAEHLRGYRDAWDFIIRSNPRAMEEWEEIRRLYEAEGVTDAALRAARQQDARRLAREAYNRARGRFWSYVRARPALKQPLEEAGLRFSGGDSTAPYWLFPDGFRERLTLEHRHRVTDAPWRAIEADNFQFVPFRENTNMLEWIRGLPEFAEW